MLVPVVTVVMLQAYHQSKAIASGELVTNERGEYAIGRIEDAKKTAPGHKTMLCCSEAEVLDEELSAAKRLVGVMRFTGLFVELGEHYVGVGSAANGIEGGAPLLVRVSADKVGACAPTVRVDFVVERGRTVPSPDAAAPDRLVATDWGLFYFGSQGGDDAAWRRLYRNLVETVDTLVTLVEAGNSDRRVAHRLAKNVLAVTNSPDGGGVDLLRLDLGTAAADKDSELGNVVSGGSGERRVLVARSVLEEAAGPAVAAEDLRALLAKRDLEFYVDGVSTGHGELARPQYEFEVSLAAGGSADARLTATKKVGGHVVAFTVLHDKLRDRFPSERLPPQSALVDLVVAAAEATSKQHKMADCNADALTSAIAAAVHEAARPLFPDDGRGLNVTVNMKELEEERDSDETFLSILEEAMNTAIAFKSKPWDQATSTGFRV